MLICQLIGFPPCNVLLDLFICQPRDRHLKYDFKHYHLWVSSSDEMRGPPHLPDPLETKMVRVADSAVEGGGQGLFANQDIPAGSIVAFYNGIRMTPEEKSPWEDRAYSIVVEWEEKRLAFPFPWDSKADHMDLPPKYHSSENYTATLAHKLNHSFTPNCRLSHHRLSI